jgi:uncharacterized membrane protein (UPF0136 family)
MATAKLVLWIYIALLVAGGLVGYLKAKSQISLYMSVGFAAALALCNIGVITGNLADILLIVLMVFFTLRLAKSKKFMPGGLMLVLTIVALALRNIRF